LSRHNYNGGQTPIERPDRWTFEKHEMEKELSQKQMELQKEKHQFDRELRELTSKLRQVETTMSTREDFWRKEKTQMVAEIAGLKTDLLLHQTQDGKAPDTNALVELLSNEKKKLETALLQKQSQLDLLEEKIKGTVKENEKLKVVDFECQMRSLEVLLNERDHQLISAERKIEELENSLEVYANNLNVPVRDNVNNEAIDQIKEQAEAQIRFERERAKRLAYKIEELKNKNKSLKQELENRRAEFAMQSQGGHNRSCATSEVLTIVKDVFDQVFGEGTQFFSISSSKLDVDFQGLRSQCDYLVQEVFYLRGYTNKLKLW
jgi:hypothetical protein